ncbi:predicted protein [Lichtheimia corymbifera JMRC:FSU:9682]|uniref:Uncharacterized protein n=1 Tax=Lichtheimia corymbifera JMRC:FSU:9682 TaxID=1263082 RepID=A0A068SBS9_9FUNG|nr:predicted protein [Lichtheimia corymbifera JMRC:FSU:9682]
MDLKARTLYVGSMQQQHILDQMDTRLFASMKEWYWEYLKNGTDSPSGDIIIITAARQGMECTVLRGKATVC